MTMTTTTTATLIRTFAAVGRILGHCGMLREEQVAQLIDLTERYPATERTRGYDWLTAANALMAANAAVEGAIPGPLNGGVGAWPVVESEYPSPTRLEWTSGTGRYRIVATRRRLSIDCRAGGEYQGQVAMSLYLSDEYGGFVCHFDGDLTLVEGREDRIELLVRLTHQIPEIEAEVRRQAKRGDLAAAALIAEVDAYRWGIAESLRPPTPVDSGYAVHLETGDIYLLYRHAETDQILRATPMAEEDWEYVEPGSTGAGHSAGHLRLPDEWANGQTWKPYVVPATAARA